MKYTPGWSSHYPVLIKVFEHTKGDVLELGMGLFSTPLLHWLCMDQHRKLISLDRQQKYFDLNRRFQSDTHKIYLVEDWNKIDINHSWSFALVDHDPAERRIEEIKKIANNTQYVIVHDTDPKENKYYHYDQIYPLFKYRYDYTLCSPNTTVLSNFFDLDFLYNKTNDKIQI